MNPIHRPTSRPSGPPLCRGRRLGAAIAAATLAAFGVDRASAASSVEFTGTFPFTSTTTAAVFPFEVLGNGEFLLATFSSTGGTTPFGTAIAPGGIDSLIEIAQNGTVLAANDDLSASAPINRDSEIRSTGYAGTARAGATVRAVLPAGNYEARLRRFASGSTAWSLVFGANGSSPIRPYAPALPSGMTLDTLTVASNVFYQGANPLVVNSLRVDSSTVYFEEAPASAATFTVSGIGTTYISNPSFTAGTASVGGAANTSTQRPVIDIGTGGGVASFTTLNVAHLVNSYGTVLQNDSTVSIGALNLGNNAGTGEVATYDLSGGTLNLTGQGVRVDGAGQNAFRLTGGRLNAGRPARLGGLVSGANFAWTGGTLAFTEGFGVPVDLLSIFGEAGVTLSAGKRLDVGPNGTFNAPVTLDGGTLAGFDLDSDVPLTWNRGTIDASGFLFVVNADGLLGASAVLSNGRTLRGDAITVAAEGVLTIQAGGVLRGTGLANAGRLVLADPGALVVGTGFTNSGTLSGAGVIRANSTNAAAGRVNLDGADELSIDGAMTNNGTVRLSGGALRVSGTLTNNESIAGRGTLAAGSLVNADAITFSGGTSDLDAPLTNANDAKLILTGNANLTVHRNVTAQAGSEFRVQAGSTVSFLGAFSGLNTLTGGGTKYFEAAAGGGALLTGDGSSVVEPDATLQTSGIRERSLVVRGLATIAADSITSRLAALTLDGGSLDLANNRLVLDYDAASPAATIRAAIVDGDLFSSATPAAGRAIGYAEAAAIGATGFGGLAVDATSLLVRWTLRGDANVDGAVTFDDLLALAQNYGAAGKVWSQGDSDHDGVVGFDDLLALAQNYNGSLAAVSVASDEASFATDWALARSLVPEPGAAMTLAVAAIGAARRGRPR